GHLHRLGAAGAAEVEHGPVTQPVPDLLAQQGLQLAPIDVGLTIAERPPRRTAGDVLEHLVAHPSPEKPAPHAPPAVSPSTPGARPGGTPVAPLQMLPSMS